MGLLMLVFCHAEAKLLVPFLLFERSGLRRLLCSWGNYREILFWHVFVKCPISSCYGLLWNCPAESYWLRKGLWNILWCSLCPWSHLFPVCASSLQKEVDTERQKVASEFKQLRLFLEEQERRRLCRLGELAKEIVKRRDENATKYSKVLSCLSELVCEMEGKCQQPTSEFLQVRLC